MYHIILVLLAQPEARPNNQDLAVLVGRLLGDPGFAFGPDECVAKPNVKGSHQDLIPRQLLGLLVVLELLKSPC